MKIIVYIFSFALFAIVSNANASLLDGKSLSVEGHYPTARVSSGGYLGTYTVGSNIEIPNWLHSSSSYIDLRDTQIEFAFIQTTFVTPDPGLVSFFGGTSFNGYQFSDISNAISPFQSVALNGNLSNLPFTFDPSRIKFDANNIWIDFQGLSFASDSKLVLDINTPISTPVPEPESYALIVAGLGLIGFMARQRK